METRDYKTWLATKKEYVAEGDIAEYLAWYMENPSPMGGVFGRELTRPEVMRQAIESAALSFTDTVVEIRHCDDPEAGARWVSAVTGTLVGLGFVCTGNVSHQAVMLRNEQGALVAIPTRNVIDMEDAR